MNLPKLFSERPFLVLPGWQDSDEGHWQTIWEKKFGWKRVVQSDWNHPSRSAWTAQILRAVDEQTAPPVLICHSLGCSALVHAVARQPALKAYAAFLVAPPNLDRPGTPAELLDFRPVPSSALPFASRVIASTNDGFSSIGESEEMAKRWGSSLSNVGNRDHIGSAANVGAWEEGQSLLAEFLLSLPVSR